MVDKKKRLTRGKTSSRDKRPRGAFWDLDPKTQDYLKKHFPGSTINVDAVWTEYVQHEIGFALLLSAVTPTELEGDTFDVTLTPPTPTRPAVRFTGQVLTAAQRAQLLELRLVSLQALGLPITDLSQRSITTAVRNYCKDAGLSERQTWRFLEIVQRRRQLLRKPQESDAEWARRFRAAGYRPSKHAVLGWEPTKLPTRAQEWLKNLPMGVLLDLVNRARNRRVYVPKRIY